MYGDIADDAVERRGQMIISELPLLRGTASFCGLQIRFGIFKSLQRVIVVLLTGYSALVESSLPLEFVLVVIKNGFLLCFGAPLLIDSRLLLQRINRHEHLSGAYSVTRLHQDSCKCAVYLRLDTRRTPRLYGCDILIGAGNRGKIDGFHLHREWLRCRCFRLCLAASRVYESRCQYDRRENCQVRELLHRTLHLTQCLSPKDAMRAC